MEFPATLEAEAQRLGHPDFVLAWDDGRRLGIEVTEAGEESYQKWMTHSEAITQEGQVVHVPLDASTQRTADEISRAIQNKIRKYDGGYYQTTSDCDLVVYDNTAWGGFLETTAD